MWYKAFIVGGFLWYWETLWVQVMSYLVCSLCVGWVQGLWGLLIGCVTSVLVVIVRGELIKRGVEDFLDIVYDEVDRYKSSGKGEDLVFLGMMWDEWLERSRGSVWRKKIVEVGLLEWLGASAVVLKAMDEWLTAHNRDDIEYVLEYHGEYDVEYLLGLLR